MEKLIEFFTNRLGISISIIGGFILPGCLFIYVFDKEMFLEMNIVKLLILASSICLAVYVIMFILSTLYMCISDKNGLKKYDITDILLYPLVYSNLLIYFWMLGKIFRKDLQITYFIKNWSVAIFIASTVIYVQLFASILKKRRRIKKENKGENNKLV